VKKLLGKGGDKEKRQSPVVSLLAVIILVLSLSSLLSLIFPAGSSECPQYSEPALSYSNMKCYAGGIVGYLITSLSTTLFSTAGSYLLFIPLIFVTLMFLVPFSVVDIIRSAKEKAPKPSVSIPLKSKKKTEPQIEEATPVQSPPYKQEPLPLVYSTEKRPRAVPKPKGEYELPSLELLKDPLTLKSRPSKDDLLERSKTLERKLRDFSIDGSVTHVSPGPVVKSTLGIEVPNEEREMVFLKEILSSEAFRKSNSKLTLALGKDIFGTPVITDLARMPHLLIAGATGSGKSVGINAMVLSLLYRGTPQEVKMLMIDPKMLELPLYEEIPHLLLPIITSPKDAADALRKMVLEMERRYRLLAEAGSRNIETYNRKIKTMPDSGEGPLPYIVIFIDEFADLMLVSAHEVENSIARLAQMARAAGIHLILATQRPSVDVITGVIKANFSSRISFHVSSKLDSRIILDTYGAEQLLGKGDMLFITPGRRTIRIHGPYITEEEIKVIVDFIRSQGSPDYTMFETLAFEEEGDFDSEDRDELYHQAKDLILSTGQASISYIQRRMKIGYNRAARIMEMMEEDGIVGPPGEAGKPREILRGR
jgi:S-DNA-T family DNA segregation ATPase FtsK/SpoIIIE